MSNVKYVPIRRSALEGAFNKALVLLQDEIKDDCNYYCREDVGTLIDSATPHVKNMELTVTWNTPYAKRVYYTGTPSTDKNPNASLQWCEKAIVSKKTQWAQKIGKAFAANIHKATQMDSNAENSASLLR